MQLKLFIIRDSKGGYFGNPLVQHSHAEAERTFKKLALDQKTDISQFPEDFDLYFIGDYDNVTGKLSALDTPHHMIKATQVLNPNPA